MRESNRETSLKSCINATAVAKRDRQPKILLPSPIEGDLSMDGWMIVTLPKTANFAAKSSPEVCLSVGGRQEGRRARKVSRPRLLAHSVFRCVNLALNVTPPPQPLPMKVREKVSVELWSQKGCSPYPTFSSSESNPYFTALSVW